MGNQSKAVEVLQRLLLPQEGEPQDVRMLYLIEDEQNHVRLRWDNRHSFTIPRGTEASFQTYFNAFPASYWRRWSQLSSVILRLAVEGTARIEVYRSTYQGRRIQLGGQLVTNGVVEFDLSLAPFEDGGWMWFDVIAEGEATITEGGWYAPQAPQPQVLEDGTQVGPFDATVTVGVPTFNRPKDAVAALQALASDPEVDAIISSVLMPDQGTQHPADEPGYTEVVAHFGERFHEYRQGNLGGSGGYSRIMYEALGTDGADSSYILFMDDDIAIEPDSILRSVQIARYAKKPFILGGQMLNLLDRASLHTMGERVDRETFMWAPADHVHYSHNFSDYPLSETDQVWKGGQYVQDNADLHRRIDADFNGWWMCLFPRVVVEQCGQPLPLFIKWDDTEYSLRAAQHGFPTVTWPGVAIWHMAWTDKDDAIDWQAYFHLRNRLIVAALNLEGSPEGMFKTMRKATFKHAMCMEYSTIAIQNEALKDFMAGPDHLFEILDTALPKVNAIRKDYPDAVKISSAAELPPAAGAPGVPKLGPRGKLRQLRKIKYAALGFKNLVSKENREHHTVPQLNLTPNEARWYSLTRLDGATVSAADGSAVYYRKRDRDLALRLTREALTLQKQAKKRFDELRSSYRAAHNSLTSRESWRKVFDAQ